MVWHFCLCWKIHCLSKTPVRFLDCKSCWACSQLVGVSWEPCQRGLVLFWYFSVGKKRIFPHHYCSLSVPHTEAGSDLPSSLRGPYHAVLKCELTEAEHIYEKSHMILQSFKGKPDKTWKNNKLKELKCRDYSVQSSIHTRRHFGTIYREIVLHLKE